ncbi:hypothetical protein GCM10009753_18630 [Streptantibioticus ferralitis]
MQHRGYAPHRIHYLGWQRERAHVGLYEARHTTTGKHLSGQIEADDPEPTVPQEQGVVSWAAADVRDASIGWQRRD